jgi:uncharacterized membrane protein
MAGRGSARAGLLTRFGGDRLVEAWRRPAIVTGSIAALLLAGVVIYVLSSGGGDLTDIRLLTANAGDAGGSGLRLCNQTTSRVGVAIGYKDGNGWTTEGWWNVTAGACETLVPGQLVSRFYYVYAVDYDRGGIWGGKAAMCTRDKMFTIRGIEDCVARGFERAGFFEVDTGEQKSWTVQLTEAGQQGTDG